MRPDRDARLRAPACGAVHGGPLPRATSEAEPTAGSAVECAEPPAHPVGDRAAAPDPRRARTLAEVREGLSRAQKELPPKLFYDQRGSELFEEITALPEYYLTRTERALLARWMPGWIGSLRPRALVELGAGSARKTRLLLDAMVRAAEGVHYVPVDISSEFLAATAAELRREYPRVVVAPLVADLAAELALPPALPRPALFAFLGSTVGNLRPREAAMLLRRLRGRMAPDDRFLLGVDLRKDPRRIEAAYNDAQGITAAFNLNMLRVVNTEVGADFEPSAFAHRAFYDPRKHRIEMHLVSTRAQVVRIPGLEPVRLREGETIRTEISCKYDQPSVAGLLEEAGLRLTRWATDPDGLYALALAAP